MPSFLAFSKDRKRALAVAEEDDLVLLFQVEQDGGLTELGRQSCPGGPAYVAFDRTESRALTASYGSGESRVYPISGGETLGPVAATLDTGKYSHSIVPSPLGKLLYVPSKGTDTIAILSLAGKAGGCTLLGAASAPSGSGPRHLVVSRDGARAYVTGENDATLLEYTIQGEELVFKSYVSTLPRPWQEGDTGSDLHLSPDGRFLYVSNRGHDSIAVFRVEDGALDLVQHESTRGRVPRNFCLFGDNLLIVANQESSNLAFYSREPSSGRLTFQGTVPTPERPFWVGPGSSLDL